MTLDFARSAAGGLLVGVVVAAVLIAIRTRVQNPVFDTTLSLLAPFVAYLPAEYIHASGVLAVVVTGLLLGHRSPVIQSAAARIAERTNWRTLQFLLENTVFLLIGLQASVIIGAVADSTLGATTVSTAAVAVLLTVIVVRPLWVFPVAYVSGLRPGASRRRDRPPWQYPALVSWAGMRGVVTLAAAFVIPASVPHRDVLLFLALVVTGGTLLLQGSTLPWLVRRLGVHGPDPAEDALQQAVVYQQTTAAGLRRLEEVGREAPELVEEIRARAAMRANAMWERLGGSGPTPSASYARLRQAMLDTERAELLRIRDTATVDHEVLEQVLTALDLEESIMGHVISADSSERADDLVARPHPDGPCRHLREPPTGASPHTAGRCDVCVAEGLDWVHLRMCLTCGNVGCCDSSVGKHAARHFQQSTHPTMRSVEPGEAWRWCFADARIG